MSNKQKVLNEILEELKKMDDEELCDLYNHLVKDYALYEHIDEGSFISPKSKKTIKIPKNKIKFRKKRRGFNA